MPTPHDVELEPIGHFRAHVALHRRHFGQRTEHVEPGDERGHVLQPPDFSPHLRAQRFEQFALPYLDALGGREHLLFILLERRRYIPLSPSQRLSALIVVGNQVPVGIRDLDEIAEHPVVAHLERGYAGAFAFRRLNTGDGILAAIAQGAQRIQRRIHARANGVFVAHGRRGAVDQGLRNALGEIDTTVPRRDNRAQRAMRGQPFDRRRHPR